MNYFICVCDVFIDQKYNLKMFLMKKEIIFMS